MLNLFKYCVKFQVITNFYNFTKLSKILKIIFCFEDPTSLRLYTN